MHMTFQERETAGGLLRPAAEVADFADYAAGLTDELARTARAMGLDMLGYLLEMAKLEATTLAACEPAQHRSPLSATPPGSSLPARAA